MRPLVNAVLALLLVAVLGAHWFLRPRPMARNFEILPDMARSAVAASYSASDVFADGKELQAPVAGTVARGFAPLRYAATPEDAARAGRELASPLPPAPKDAADLARGAWVFATYCQVCHGAGGLGDGPVAQRGFPAPPSLLAPHARGLADGQLFHILSFGQNNMPSYAAQVDRLDRWRAVAYVRSLQAASPAPPPDAAAATAPPATGAPAAPATAAPATPVAPVAAVASPPAPTAAGGAR